MKTLLVELFVLVAFSVTLSHCNPKCPRGWINYRRSCYQFNRNILNWYEAAAACRKERAHLVTVDDADENQFILNQLLAQDNIPYFGINHYRTCSDSFDSSEDYSVVWIGLTDLFQEGFWQWSDTDNLLGFTYWNGNQIPSVSDNKNCAHYGMPSTMQWHDTNCFKTGSYICEV